MKYDARWKDLFTEPSGHLYGSCSRCSQVRNVDYYCGNCGAKMSIYLKDEFDKQYEREKQQEKEEQRRIRELLRLIDESRGMTNE